MEDYQDIRGPDRQLLPKPYLQMALHGANNFFAWKFISTQERSETLRIEYQIETSSPNSTSVKDIQPFAHSTTCDDIAGFIIDDGKISSKVLVAHLTWSGKPEADGFPSTTVYNDFIEWLKECVCEDLRSG